MAHATDIVGYTYRADIYCPDHIVSQLTVNPGDVAHRNSVIREAETNLDTLARLQDVDRYDESSFDSDEFPKVVFRDHLDDMLAQRCGVCFELLDTF